MVSLRDTGVFTRVVAISFIAGNIFFYAPFTPTISGFLNLDELPFCPFRFSLSKMT
jgi:hypothetical protein